MGGPGYVYLVGCTTEHGSWAKVGVAARIGRVHDHRDWAMLERTFEAEFVLLDARSLEQSVLRQFKESGKSPARCGRCGAPKPRVGRTGTDGLTEVRHLECFPELKQVFQDAWTKALRLPRDAAWQVDFDPLDLRPGGFKPVGDPWRQPPRMDPSEYQANTCNAICVRGEPASTVVAFLDEEWESGTVNLRRALVKRFGKKVRKKDGSPTPGAKGTGVGSQRTKVEKDLYAMTTFTDVDILLLSVRKPGMLYGYRRPSPRPQ